MYGLRSRLLPENHYWADYYLRKVWSSVVEITAGLQTPDLPDHLEAKFEPYISHEEERIRKNLQDIRFDIDALDTVYVVAGPGRIEKVGKSSFRSFARFTRPLLAPFSFDLSAP